MIFFGWFARIMPATPPLVVCVFFCGRKLWKKVFLNFFHFENDKWEFNLVVARLLFWLFLINCKVFELYLLGFLFHRPWMSFKWQQTFEIVVFFLFNSQTESFVWFSYHYCGDKEVNAGFFSFSILVDLLRKSVVKFSVYRDIIVISFSLLNARGLSFWGLWDNLIS